MDNPENTEEAGNSGQSRETGNIGYTRHNTIFVGHHYAQTNTNNLNTKNVRHDPPTNNNIYNKLV